MAFYKIKSGRDNGALTATNYVGEFGHLFYSLDDNILRISDGHTPGGIAINGTVALSNNPPTNPNNGSLWYDELSGRLYVWYENTWVDASPIEHIRAATTTTLGGIIAGPGVQVGNDGTLTIDTAGLPLSFGDITVVGSTLSSINADENITLESNGTGTVAVVGEFLVTTTTGTNVIQTLANGTLNLYVPQVNSLDSAIDIIGSSDGSVVSPNNTGVMLHITGQDQGTTASRVYNDGVGGYAAYIGRRYDGTSAGPQGMTYSTSTLSQNIIARFGATPYTSTGWPSVSTARMDMMIRETPTGSVMGSEIQFWTTDIGSMNIQPQLIINNQGVSHSSDVIPTFDEIASLGNPSHRWANIYLGQGSLYVADQTTNQNVQISVNSGTFYINGAQNVVLGSLVITGDTVQSANPSANVNIGDINDTGLFTVSRRSYISSPYFSTSTALLTIDGVNSTSTIADLTIAGTLIHAVNQPGNNAAIVVDSFGTGIWPIYMARAARGTVADPEPVQNGDVLFSIVGNGYGGGFTAGYGAIPNTSRIDFVATDTYSPTTRGSQIDFWAIQPGATTATQVAAVDYLGMRTNGITFSNDNSYQTTAGIPANTVGISNGIAQLGSDGRLLASQIPTSLQGAVTFSGGWDASTNTPTLANGVGTTGTEYVITTSGTQNLGGGNVTYLAGGFVIYGAGVWNYTPSASAFISISAINHISVNTATGVIQVTSDATPNNTTATIVARDGFGNFSAGVITATLNGAATLAGTAATVTGANQPAITSVGALSSLTVIATIAGSINGNAATATKLATTTTINGVSFDGSAAIVVHTAGTGISISGTQITNTGVLNTATLMTSAVNATTATYAGYAYGFNTGTLVSNAVTASNVVNAVTSVSTGTGIRVSATTGSVQISFANDAGYITASGLSSYVSGQGYTTTATVTGLIANSLTNYATQSYVAGLGYITSTALTPYTPTSGLGAIIANSLTNSLSAYTTTSGLGAVIANSLTNYATQSYVAGLGYITSSALAPYTTTATVTGLIANSLTNYATQTYVNSQGFITSSALSPYTTTATVTSLIANSLTNYATQSYIAGLNYATQSYVTSRGYITSSSLSVTTGSAVSGGALAYSTTTGMFTFNPATAYTLTTATNSALGGVKIGANITAAGDGTISVAAPYTLTTGTASALGGVKIGSGINAAGDGTISVTPFNTSTLVAHAVLADTATTATNAGYAYSFNTGTLVTTAVTANTVAGGYVSSITAGTGTAVSTSTGNITVWNTYSYTLPVATTSTLGGVEVDGTSIVVNGSGVISTVATQVTSTTTAAAITVPLNGAGMYIYTPSTNANVTVTLSNFTPGRTVRMFITPAAGPQTFSFTGVTAGQTSLNKINPKLIGGGATSMIAEIYCTTNVIGGIYINFINAQ